MQSRVSMNSIVTAVSSKVSGYRHAIIRSVSMRRYARMAATIMCLMINGSPLLCKCPLCATSAISTADRTFQASVERCS